MPVPLDRISSSEFVIRSVDGVKLSKILKPLGDLVGIPGQKDTFLIRLVAPASNPRVGWNQLRTVIGSHGQVLPVFLGEHEQPKYSVGTLQVRFPSPPSDDELYAWLPAGLRVKARNEYIPSQISLEPAEPTGQFLPDLIADLRQHNGDQVQVWPETLQLFRKT